MSEADSRTSNQRNALADLFQYWLDWNQEQRAKEGLECNDDCHVIQVPPHWPTRGNLRAWIKVLRSQDETTALLTDAQCDHVVSELEGGEWSGISRDDVRLWDRFISEARSQSKASDES